MAATRGSGSTTAWSLSPRRTSDPYPREPPGRTLSEDEALGRPAKKNALVEAPARVDALARELESVCAELPAVWLETSKDALT